MPFTLPPLSRRGFLRGSFAAAAASCLGPLAVRGLHAASSQADPHRFALLSDTHIAADRSETARDTNMAANLEAVVRDVIARSERAGAVLVNGDCAFRDGQKGDYVVFTELLEPLRAAGMPVHLTMGNHDARENFREVVGEARLRPSLMADREVALVRGERAHWLLVDSSTQPMGAGRMGREQLELIARLLDENADRPVIVYGHHNPEDGMSKYPLEDTTEFFAVLAPRRQVKAYIFGHSHRWEIGRHGSGIHLVNLPPTAYVFTDGRPNGWVEAVVQADGLSLELHTLAKAHRQNGEKHRLRWRS
jgi:Icc protein